MSFLHRMPAAVIVALLAPAAATAAWSPPTELAVPGGPSAQAVAVNARGDAAVAFATTSGRGSAARASVTVRLTRATGRVVTHRLWSGAGDVRAVSVVIDRRGEATVAWGAAGAIHTAYGPLVGRWSSRQTVRGTVMEGLAVSPRDEVLLALATEREPGVDQRGAVAWRRHGRPFGPRTLLSAPRVFFGGYLDAPLVPVFDGQGAAYLSSPCDGTIARAEPGSRRFRAITLLRGWATGLSLSVGASGSGFVSFGAGGCNSGAMEGGAAGPLIVVPIIEGEVGYVGLVPSVHDVVGTRNVTMPGAPGFLTWSVSGSGTLMTSRLTRSGLDLPPAPAVPGAVPLAADWQGDLVVGEAQLWQDSTDVYRVAVRPAEGGPDQPAPAAPATLAIARPGRRIAALWLTYDAARQPSGLALSTWSP